MPPVGLLRNGSSGSRWSGVRPRHPLQTRNSHYFAARHVLRGESPFLAEGYIYPPLLALLMAPLGALGYLTARWVWFVFSQGCLLLAAWLVYRCLGRSLLAACSVALMWAGGRAAGEALGLGQLGPELALLVAIAYTATDWPQGAGLAARGNSKSRRKRTISRPFRGYPNPQPGLRNAL